MMENGKWQMGERSADIPTRAFDVGVRVIKFCQYLYTQRGVARLMANQILSAGTSIGANVQEGQAAQSRADFIAKYSISLKEARETGYRMRLLMAAEVVPMPRVGPLAAEVEELAKMIGRAIVTAKRNRSAS